MIDTTRLIWTLGKELFLSGAARELTHRMAHPQVGDLVVEISSLRGYDPDGVGFLRAEEPNRDDPHDTISVIEPLDKPGEEVRWGNAQLIAVPTERRGVWLAEALGETRG